ncbi:integration host factor subunit alpha [Microvirga lotononidis]|uniref:Integration host factor subunit alpha n=1 Tax=Microvirga lotononidis TaxID=864069 RepID=I4YK72_9HYPH|nr:integration host factor subunit alpha [Microvirga lotononidis]EIM24364.1 bacterial nucleoid DNA-binding protein [Microvirga lotononidis]WQO30328.1 integration host factor subunit alpha [Microvirga lotononidis]
MVGKNVIRTDLADAVCQKVGISRAEAMDLVSQVLGEMCDALVTGESVKLSGFGIFHVRDKARRVGRNPKTGVEVPIEPRQSIMFSASPVLKARVNGGRKKPARTRAKRGSASGADATKSPILK